MSPRLTDWSIAIAARIRLHNRRCQPGEWPPQEWLIFVLHAIGGFWLLLLMWGKLRRVWPRFDSSTALGSPHSSLDYWRSCCNVGARIRHLVGTGGVWNFCWIQSVELAYYPGLRTHISYTLSYVSRAKRFRKRDIVGRRRALHFSVLLLGGVALWPGQADRRACAKSARRKAAFHWLS